MPPVKLLLVDDHAVVRQSLRRILDQQPGLLVVGEASDGLEAVERAVSLRPDLVIMDAAMPRLGGIEATRRIRKQARGVRVLVLSQHTDQATVSAALEAGAHGFVCKADGLEELFRAVEVIAGGEHYVSAELSGFLVRAFLDRKGGRPNEPLDQLTERERELVQLVAEGHSGPEIAEQMGVGVRTVESHKRRIADKIGFSDAAGLTRWALKHGLIPPDL